MHARPDSKGGAVHGLTEFRDIAVRVGAAYCIESGRPRRARILLSIEEACSRYMLTVDELLSWQSSLDQHGLAGLRTTRTQQYRM
jgi:hypothetical protein